MKVLALIYGDEGRWDSFGEDERNAVYAGYRAFGGAAGDKVGWMSEQGIEASGLELEDPNEARVVRVRDGRPVVTDGPFAETKEVLGGYFLADCKDLDQAIELAQRIPLADKGSVEIRPLVEQ